MNLQLKLLDDAKQSLVERVHAHSFLKRCRAKSVSLDELKLFLVQQGLYSGYFTRYLCALMANLPSGDQVIKLAENLCEELGLTEDSGTPHSIIYREMLQHFGLSLSEATPTLGTLRLIDTMFDHCRDPKSARGLGALCLGAEALVPTMYSDIIAAFDGCGIPHAKLSFFHIHVECDDGHADTMRDIMVDMASRDPQQIPMMLNAGTAMVDARLSFFDSIEAFNRQQPDTEQGPSHAGLAYL